MANSGQVWFTSDNHFGHKNIKNFCPMTRPSYEDVSEMDELMIHTWRAQVQPHDTVYCLGDFSFHNAERTWDILRQLPGYKHLILGNHDKVLRNQQKLANAHFVSVQEYKEVSIDGIKVVLFHYPIWEWNGMHYGAFHLYGHVHGTTKVPGRAVDVGIDGPLSRGELELYNWQTIKTVLSERSVRKHNGQLGAAYRDL